METEFINWLRSRLPPEPGVKVSPGDDAAILDWSRENDCVVTADLLAEGTHFRLDETTADRIARKAINANLSDLAAMAAQPRSLFISLLLPRRDASTLARELFDGFLSCSKEYDCPICGGDTNCWDGPLVISVTAVGSVTEHGSWLRSGAKVGDSIVVTGLFGGSLQGRHLDFRPRVREALYLNAHHEIHAAIDVTDGLSLDLSRVCSESKCGAVLDLSAIPISQELKNRFPKPTDHDTRLSRALSDGEDFELLMTMPPREANDLLTKQPLSVRLTVIGRIVEQAGLWHESDGQLFPLGAHGFEHG